MKRLIHNKLFLSSFVADLISNFGDTLYYLALMNYVLLLPDTKFALAMITASETLPILAGLFIGIWADKTKNKLDTILATLVVRVGLYAFVGFLMGFAPALWVVAAEDRETAMAFKMTVKSLLQIAFQASGAILIGFMSYQNLAFFNAGTFLVSLAIMATLRPALAKLLKENPIQEAEQTETEAGIIKGMRNSLKESYQAVQNIPVLKASIVTIASLNAIFTALSPLVILNMKEFSDFVIVNAGTTVALISIFFSVGSILGSSIGMALFKNVSLINLLKFSTLMPVLIFSGFFLHNIYVVLTIIFVTAMTLGVFNPKMNALVLNELPEDKLATVGGGIDAFCQIGMVAGQALVALMVTVLSATSISLIFLLLSVGLVSYTILVGRKSKNEVVVKA
ncbi:MFS transporter [Streptococcus suis]|uniref:MFS transporter n=1 Tax=Streptococcus suis TaxID=1307 RepID=UPI001EE95C4D|nr:MFS transporter [Streptococcus suis]MBS7929044.1 MFS transporter [Streptococcus suis]HEM3006737.1 MFS transporter [Streptococcus suis]